MSSTPIVITLPAPAGYFGASSTPPYSSLYAAMPNPPAFYQVSLVDGVTGATTAAGGTIDGTYEIEFDYNEYETWGVGVNGPNLHCVQQPQSNPISNAASPLVHKMFQFLVVGGQVVGQRDLRVLGTENSDSASVSNIVNNTPIAVTNNADLPSMGSESLAAPIPSNLSVLSYPVITGTQPNFGSYDCAATFTVDLSPTTSSWLAALALFAVPAGDVTDDPRIYPWGSIPVAQWSGSTLTAVWTAIGAGASKDLYIAYEDGQGRFSLTAKVGTTVANPAGTGALLGIPTTPPNITSGSPTFAYAANGGGTYDAEVSVTLDGNGYYNAATGAGNTALAEYECVKVASASATLATWLAAGGTNTESNFPGWAVAGTPQLVQASGSVALAWGGCGVQVAYIVGLRYVGQNGSRSYVAVVGTTTAAQLAQIPFAGVVVDPSTGYIIISDTQTYSTYLPYQLSAAGIGSMLSASWNHKSGSTAVSPAIILMFTAGGTYNTGYYLVWFEGDGKLYILKNTGSASNVLATSTVVTTRDATNFHNMEFVASQTTSGTVNLQGILDGNILVSYSDSSSALTSGYIAAEFRDALATNYIDEKTIEINLGGSPSSSGIKAQASIAPATIPFGNLGIVSPTGSPAGQRVMTVTGQTMNFADGSTITFSTFVVFADLLGADGVWYFSVGLVLATLKAIYYLSQTAPTAAQLLVYSEDGIVPITVGNQLTVTPGATTNLGFGGGLANVFVI
jgi:hypothetical protein